MKLYNLFEELILESVKEKLLVESVDFNTVKDSIMGKYNVKIVYVDGDGVRTSRYIQPYVLGDTLAGNKAIRAYQIFGGSRTMTTSGEQAQGGWRIFRLDRIVDWVPTNMKFKVPISDLPSFMISRGRFNPNGDKMFNTIDAIAKFGKEVDQAIKPINVPIEKPQPVKPNTSKQQAPTQQPEVEPQVAKQNSYSTGKDPKPNITTDTSKTTSVDTSNTTGQQMNNNKQKQDNNDTTTSRFK